MSTFYLGTHKTGWLAHAAIPLFVSHRTLSVRRTLPRAAAPWALDSGGFSELSLYGEWRTSPAEYLTAVRRYASEVGALEWAAPQDWMCEPVMLTRTGLSVAEHQRRTTVNFLALAAEPLVIPVLQGWTRDDYLRHADAYLAAGVELDRLERVGLGSVCRRHKTAMVVSLIAELAGAGIRLHAFGLKSEGWLRASGYLASADSMAWSRHARNRPPLPGCPHRSCQNCLRYALRWRERFIGGAWQPTLPTVHR